MYAFIYLHSGLPFDGYAIGGSLGEDHEDMCELLEYLMPLLADDKRPRHLLGIGDERCVPLPGIFPPFLS